MGRRVREEARELRTIADVCDWRHRDAAVEAAAAHDHRDAKYRHAATDRIRNQALYNLLRALPWRLDAAAGSPPLDTRGVERTRQDSRRRTRRARYAALPRVRQGDDGRAEGVSARRTAQARGAAVAAARALQLPGCARETHYLANDQLDAETGLWSRRIPRGPGRSRPLDHRRAQHAGDHADWRRQIALLSTARGTAARHD